jgi:hypothetical protein
MKVQISLFAAPRELVGASSVEIEVPGDACSGATLRAALVAAYPVLKDIVPRSLLFVGTEQLDESLADGICATSAVTLVSPVSGG